MLYILIAVLMLISVACFWEGKNERKGLKFTLSISLVFLLSFIMEATAQSLVSSDIFTGLPLMIAYFVLPILSFSSFQLLLYEIRLID